MSVPGLSQGVVAGWVSACIYQASACSSSHMSQGGIEGAAQLQLDSHKLKKSSALFLRDSQDGACMLPSGFLSTCRGQLVFLLLRALNPVVLLC